ncbi:MAG: hypothetical protein ACC613_06795 [Synergistales bacterium]
MFGMTLRPGVTVQKGKAQPNRPTVCRVEATPPRRNLPVLWRICTRCDQTGIDKLRGLPQRCPDCGGKAIILTEDGKAILELLEVVESHSPVTDEAVQEAIEKHQAEIKERARRQEEERKAAEKREEERQKALEKLVKAGFSPDELLR